MSVALLFAAVLAQSPSLRVVVDSARHEVVLTAGPFVVPGAHGEHDSMHHQDHLPALIDFRWPVSGWARGFSVAVSDAQGRARPRALLHHLNLVNFERRQPVHPAYERLIALGRETDDLKLPRTIGVPLEAGSHFALLVAWGAVGHETEEGLQVTLRIPWLPANTAPAPHSVLPWPIDANYQPVATDAYDLPPGPSNRSLEFTVPASGRLLAIGGHLHDYGTELRIEEAETGKLVVDLRPTSDQDGKVTAMSRKLPGLTGDGIELKEGRRYRLVASYDNPTGKVLELGAMAVMAGLFAPDHPARWNGTNLAGLAADSAGLARLRQTALSLAR